MALDSNSVESFLYCVSFYLVHCLKSKLSSHVLVDNTPKKTVLRLLNSLNVAVIKKRMSVFRRKVLFFLLMFPFCPFLLRFPSTNESIISISLHDVCPISSLTCRVDCSTKFQIYLPNKSCYKQILFSKSDIIGYTFRGTTRSFFSIVPLPHSFKSSSHFEYLDIPGKP